MSYDSPVGDGAADNLAVDRRAPRVISRPDRRVILAASLGTAFEWYDFFLYGSLAAVISRQFFAGVNETSAFIFALLAFAAGFAVRPLGALVFGRLGDRTGRKRTFLITIIIMGAATALVGVLPTYATIGIWAPVLLIALRLLQGLAIGGEYGGAAIYVAEHASPDRRGYYTGWIQTTATAGLILSLLVILLCRAWLGPAFEEWGWRIPFLLSLVLLGISVYIRLRLEESPVFKDMKSTGTLSSAPITESLTRWSNLRIVLLAIFGATAGQAVIGYCAQIYVFFFLSQTLKVDAFSSNILVLLALALATPLFVFFGWLSDRIGRKPVVLSGALCAVLTLIPIFNGLTGFANPALEAASRRHPIVLKADPASCHFQLDLLGRAELTSGCDIAKRALAGTGVPYENEEAAAGATTQVRVGEHVLAVLDASESAMDASGSHERGHFRTMLLTTLESVGYPSNAAPALINYRAVLGLVFLLAVYMTMVYGPLAAWLVELFPARIRYTSLSTAYHIGNGWFGGFLPTVAFALVAMSGNIYAGLWYPIVMGCVMLLVGVLLLPETRARQMN